MAILLLKIFRLAGTSSRLIFRMILVIEVAESSQQKDRHVKPDLYATAGVPEYWVVDLVERAVFVHRQNTDGRYHDVSRHALGARVSCRALADLAVQVEDLFPYQR